MKFALKNIFRRRASYVWLLIELTLVTFLSWFVMDQLVVLTWQYSRNPGYDLDRLAIMQYRLVQPESNDYLGERSDDEREGDIRRILAAVRAMPEVESATIGVQDWYPEGSFSLTTGIPVNDSTMVSMRHVGFVPGEDFFRTFGINGADGTPAKALDAINPVGEGNWHSQFSMGGGEPFMLTESVANIYYPGGHPLESNDSARNEPNGRFIGKLLAVVEDFNLFTSEYNSVFVGLSPQSLRNVSGYGAIIARMRPGYSPRDFADRLTLDLESLKEGNTFIESAKSYSELAEEHENSASGIDRRVNRIIAIFFLLNIAVGVTGTFWMMTRRRTEEVGVLRAFGATPGRVRRLLVGEACIVGAFAWLLGCGLYLYWALDHGLYAPEEDVSQGLLKTWLDNFPLHFAIIAAVILAMVLLAVIVGVLFPAWRLSRVNPVDALRDE